MGSLYLIRAGPSESAPVLKRSPNALFSLSASEKNHAKNFQTAKICESSARCAIGVLTNRTILSLSCRHPFLGASLRASLEPMLKDQRASVFLPLTVALTITVTWWP